MCVITNDQADCYNVIKKKCLGDFGVASQVIQLKTIMKNKSPSNLCSLTKSVAIQIQCKAKGAENFFLALFQCLSAKISLASQGQTHFF